MNIEALLTSILRQTTTKMAPDDSKIIQSILDQIKLKNFISSDETDKIHTIIKKYKIFVTPYIKYYIEVFTNSKIIFNETLGKIIIDIEDDPKFKKIISITSNSNTKNFIKYINGNNTLLRFHFWDIQNKKWKLALIEKNIEFISHLINEFKSTVIVNDELKLYIDKIREIKNNKTIYIPTLIKENDYYKFNNLPNNEKLFDNLSDALFEAKKSGVNSIDPNIYSTNEYKNYTATETKFFNDRKFINIENINELKNLSKYLLPTIVMLPDNNELEILKECLTFFNSIGVNDNEISVLFRLSNTYSKDFNSYIKDRGINYLCNNTTKVIFIKKVIPKIIFQTNINHKTIIVFKSKNRTVIPFRTRLFMSNTLNNITIGNETKV